MTEDQERSDEMKQVAEAIAGVTLPVDPNEPGRLCGCECANVSGGTPEPTDGGAR